MNEGFQFFDIILFAMIAAFLVFRLRSMLGRRTGNEPKPGDNMASRRSEAPGDGNVVELPDKSSADDEPETAAPDDPLAQGVAQIQSADSDFTAAGFLEGACSAFEMVVHGFATGDTGTLRALLNDDVYDDFAAAIKERLGAGETLETTVISIKSSGIIEAAMEGRMAVVTVKVVSEQVNVTRDTEGRVVDGDPNQMTDVVDIWTFSRNTRARDPNWKLIETRSQN